MALSPQQALETTYEDLDEAERESFASLEARIDNDLKHHYEEGKGDHVIPHERIKTLECPHLGFDPKSICERIDVAKVLTPRLRRVLRSQYIQAGWGDMLFHSSSHDGGGWIELKLRPEGS